MVTPSDDPNEAVAVGDESGAIGLVGEGRARHAADEPADPPLSSGRPQDPADPPPSAGRPQDPAVASVERIRERLTELDELPVDKHVEVYEDLHAQLTAALRAVDNATNSVQGG